MDHNSDHNDEKPTPTDLQEDNKYYVTNYSDHIYCLDNSPTSPNQNRSQTNPEISATEPSTSNAESRFFKENQKLKSMLLLNLDLVQEQSEQILSKNQEIQRLTHENEMLKAKLNRIETRRKTKNKSVQEGKTKNHSFILVKPQNVENKKQNEVDDNRNDICDVNGETNGEKLIAPQVNAVQKINKIVLQRVRSTKGDMNAKIISPRKEEEPTLPPPPACPDPKEIIKKDIYAFDSNSNDVECFESQQKSPAPPLYMTTDKNYNINHWRDVQISEAEKLESIDSNLEIPSWTTKEISSSYTIEGTEDLSENVFLKRHSKFEIDEKRRKKWDLMRIREEKTIQRLKKRHEGYSAESSGSGGVDSVYSFYPCPSEIKLIHFCDEVPVQAFADSIPLLATKEFSLPWSLKQHPQSQTQPQQQQSSSSTDGLLTQKRTKYICRKNIYPALAKRKYAKYENKK